MKNKKCYFCGNTFGFNECRILVRKAIKPKGTPYRWKTIGHSCEDCAHENITNFEYTVEISTFDKETVRGALNELGI